MAVMNGRKVPWAVLTVLAGMAAAPALANESSAADVQWAQIILKEKGFNIGGRANGQMTPQTRAALSQYQKAAGLPVTGNLDSATVAKMMGDRKASGTVGNLASQKPGSTPKLSERDVAPRAATRAGDVHSQGGGGDVMLGPIVRQPPPGVTIPPPSASGGSSSVASSSGATQRFTPPPPTASSGTSSHAAAPSHTAPAVPAAPRTASAPSHASTQSMVADAGPAVAAAPRAAVTATTADGKEVPTTLLSKGDEDGMSLPGWLRYVVMAVLAGTLGFVGFGWWRSGRTEGPGSAPASADNDEDRAVNRREPSFTPSRDELMTGPRLGAARSGRVR